MLDIGIFSPHGPDHERNLEFCRDTDVRHIVLGTANIDSQDDDGVPLSGAIKDLADQYADAGVSLAALTPPRIPQTAFADLAIRKSELQKLGRIVQEYVIDTSNVYDD